MIGFGINRPRDESAEFWASRAKTPKTRPRIRRLSVLHDVSGGVLLVGMGLFVLMIGVSIVLAVWFAIAHISRPDVFLWGFGIALGVVVLGATAEVVVSGRLEEAKYADADAAAGVVDSVTTTQETGGEGDVVTVFHVNVTARISEELVLRRRMEVWERDNGNPDETWTGRTIRFRHNTEDPDDLSDARFDRLPDWTAKEAG